jgi:putative transposase
VHHLIAVMNVSERFACRVIGQHRPTQRHRPRSQTPTDPDAALREWLRQWAHDHPRWGFRRAYHAARAEAGMSTTYACSDSSARRACGCRSVAAANASAPAPPPRSPTPNRVWAVDLRLASSCESRDLFPQSSFQVGGRYRFEVGEVGCNGGEGVALTQALCRDFA